MFRGYKRELEGVLGADGDAGAEVVLSDGYVNLPGWEIIVFAFGVTC